MKAKLINENIDLLQGKAKEEIETNVSDNAGLKFQKDIMKTAKSFLESIGLDFEENMFGYIFGSILQQIDENAKIDSFIEIEPDLEVFIKDFDFNIDDYKYSFVFHGDIIDPENPNKKFSDGDRLGSMKIFKNKNIKQLI